MFSIGPPSCGVATLPHRTTMAAAVITPCVPCEVQILKVCVLAVQELRDVAGGHGLSSSLASDTTLEHLEYLQYHADSCADPGQGPVRMPSSTRNCVVACSSSLLCMHTANPCRHRQQQRG